MGFISPWFGPSAKQYCQLPKSLVERSKKASIQLYITKQKICHAFLDSSQRSSNPCSASPRQVSRSIFGALGTAWCEPNTQVSKSPSTVLESLPPYYISGAQIDLELKAQTPALSCIFSGSGLRFDMCQDGWKPANISEPTTQAPKQLTSKRAKLFWVGTIPMQNGKEDH